MWPTPTINFALLCWIYLSAIYRSVRDCETENECPVDSQNESHFLSPPASDCEGLVLSVQWMALFSSLRCGPISSIRHCEATPRVEEPGFPGLTSHRCLDTHYRCNCWWLHHLVIRSSHVSHHSCCGELMIMSAVLNVRWLESASHPSGWEEKSTAVPAADTDGANITVIMRALQCCSAHYTQPRNITPGPGNLTHIALNSNKETFPKPRQLPSAPCSMASAGAGRIKRYQMILSPSRRIMSIKATRETEQFFRGHQIL